MDDMPSNPTKQNRIHLIYMHKEDLTLDNQQWLICNKTQSTCRDISTPLLLHKKKDCHEYYTKLHILEMS